MLWLFFKFDGRIPRRLFWVVAIIAEAGFLLALEMTRVLGFVDEYETAILAQLAQTAFVRA